MARTSVQVSIVAPPSDPFILIPKAMWTYLPDLPTLTAVATFATSFNISTVNLFIKSVDRTAMLDPANPAISTIHAMRSSGVAVYALAGEPTWATTTSFPNQLSQLLNLHTLYDLFDGFHLDIEPASLPEWDLPNGPRDLMQGTADFITMVKGRIGALPLEIAVQPVHALTLLSSGQDFLSTVNPFIDQISIMAYRNDPARQITRAEPCFTRAQALNLKWRMGTLCNPPTEANTSYYGSTSADFKLKMNELWTAIYPEPWLTSLVFENYETLGLILN